MLSLSKNDSLRFVKLLGLNQTKPALENLKKIIQAYMLKVPFENISKLYYLKTTGLNGIPGFEQFLSGIEKFHFGGTCYSNNYYLNLLLKFLGYEVKLCGADMSKPDVHIANIVAIENQEYIVDAGYGAPFLEPLPRNLQVDYIISSGINRYVLRPKDKNGCSRMDLYINNVLQHGYLLKPQSRSIDEFEEIIAGSFSPGATFMNSILLAKFSPGYADIIHNLTYMEIKNDIAAMKTINSKEELVVIINKVFGIPANILKIVLADLPMNQGVWG
jgi:arylamine N-acetyltransferase